MDDYDRTANRIGRLSARIVAELAADPTADNAELAAHLGRCVGSDFAAGLIPDNAATSVVQSFVIGGRESGHHHVVAALNIVVDGCHIAAAYRHGFAAGFWSRVDACAALRWSTDAYAEV